MIKFDDVSKRYPGGQEALSHVSFHLKNGEFAFLTGHSGAGKSTLLKLIMHMELPSSGQLIVNGQNLNKLARKQVPFYRRNIGLVFQDHQLLFDRSVFDNVALPLLIGGFDSRETPRRVRAALDKVGLLHKEHQNPMALSSGEQQRVGIARAVVNKPALILADEPTGNLDPELSTEIMELFKLFNSVGVSVLIASHDFELIRRMQHRMLVLGEGRLLDDAMAQAGEGSWFNPEKRRKATKAARAESSTRAENKPIPSL